jgi:SNF2 family DNA or RNA helicase
MDLLVPFDKYQWPMRNPEHKPYKHQMETSVFLIMNKRAFVLNDLGTGKTLSALWACDFLMLNSKIKKVLISSPLSTIKSVWGNEIFFNFNNRKYALAHGRREDRDIAIRSKVDFVIINHDGLITMERELIREKFDVFIIDEMTAFKNHKTDRYKSAKAIADKCKAVWGMTAEPTPNSPVEAYGQAKIVNSANPFLPPLFTKYRDMVEEKITTHISMPKLGAEQMVHKILQPSIRFERNKCVDIPPCQYIDMEIQMTEAQVVAYNQMKKTLIIEYESGLITAANAAVKAMKLTQVAAGWVKDDEGKIHEIDSKSRLDELWEIYQNTHRGKLVVFAAFRAAVEGIAKFFKGKKVVVEFIYGSTPQNQRADFINRFQNGDINVLIIQPQSSSHGITLTAADTIVWHSLVPSGEVYNQANGRITRIGQTRKQTIIHFLGCQAERRIRTILKNKDSMSKGTLLLFADPRQEDFVKPETST